MWTGPLRCWKPQAGAPWVLPAPVAPLAEKRQRSSTRGLWGIEAGGPCIRQSQTEDIRDEDYVSMEHMQISPHQLALHAGQQQFA